MRKEYEMTEEQYTAIMEASKPVPYIIIGGQAPSTQQENANAAWQRLGTELNLDSTT